MSGAPVDPGGCPAKPRARLSIPAPELIVREKGAHMPKQQPAAKFRVGSVTATIWLNQEKYFSVVLSKSYKDKESDEWKDTDQLGHGDLLNAARALQRAEDWIAEEEQHQ